MIWGIWGAGREGQAALRWLHDRFPDAATIMADENPQALPTSDANLVDAEPGLNGLLSASRVIVSPGVPGIHPFRQVLADKGIRLTTGTSLWMETHADESIGVTGTKGKSTTASLITALLNQCGHPSRLAGNIGVPLLSLPETPGTTVVELSSYQCHLLTHSPHLAVIVNLYQEHLTWHGSLEAYWRDKCRVFTEGARTLIVDADTLSTLHSLGIDLGPLRALTPSEDQHHRVLDAITSLHGRDLPLLFSSHHGRHNLALALAATQADGASVSRDALRSVIADFRTLPHRMSRVRQNLGRDWYDDTLSTSAESVIAAAQSLESSRRILIVGGQSRGISYEGLSTYLLDQEVNPVRVITIPSNGDEIAARYRSERPEFVKHADSLDDAVRMAAQSRWPGDPDDPDHDGVDVEDPSPRPIAVILSPGAPSYDLYPNFEAKSAAFAAAIDQMGTDRVRPLVG